MMMKTLCLVALGLSLVAATQPPPPPTSIGNVTTRPPPCMLRLFNSTTGLPNSTCNYEDFDMVDSATLRDDVTLPALMEHLRVLQSQADRHPGGNRAAGSAGHNDTAAYIAQRLDALDRYYAVEKQPFSQEIRVPQAFVLRVGGEKVTAQGLAPAGRQVQTGRIVLVERFGCDAIDYPPEVRGQIALLGTHGLEGQVPKQDHVAPCPLEQVERAAQEQGAAAVVTAALPGRILEASAAGVPLMQIFQSDGLELRHEILNGTEKVATVRVHAAPVMRVNSYNLIATTRHGDAANTLMLGAHTDSVASGPGINDNGSGTAALLELATQLSRYRTTSRVRFAFWTAEESGLLGSKLWVDSQPATNLDDLRLYLNFDMIASPNFKLGAYDGDGSDAERHAAEAGLPAAAASSSGSRTAGGPRGSEHAERLFDEFFWAQGWNTSSSAFDGRSDYGPFIWKGIPAGGTFTGADGTKTDREAGMFGGAAGAVYDENYHQEGDTLGNVHEGAFEINAAAIAHALGTYGGEEGFGGFPAREGQQQRREGGEDAAMAAVERQKAEIERAIAEQRAAEEAAASAAAVAPSASAEGPGEEHAVRKRRVLGKAAARWTYFGSPCGGLQNVGLYDGLPAM